jgi:hypothetical protein
MYSYYLKYRGHRIQIKNVPTSFRIQRAQDSNLILLLQDSASTSHWQLTWNVGRKIPQ